MTYHLARAAPFLVVSLALSAPHVATASIALVVDLPAGISPQSCDPTVAISTILSHQRDHVRQQTIFVCAAPRLVSLDRSMLAKNPTGPPLRYLQLVTHVINAGPTPCRAKTFPFAASVRIILPKVRSETALRSRSFSF